MGRKGSGVASINYLCLWNADDVVIVGLPDYARKDFSPQAWPVVLQVCV